MGLYFWQGLLLGLSAAASPGPFQAYLLAQTLRSGWKRILPAALAPVLSDVPIITLILLALSQLPASFLRIIQFAGGIFLLYLAYGAYQSFRHFNELEANAAQTGSLNFFQAILVNGLSPGPYLFWGLVGAPILLDSWKTDPVFSLAFLLGFYAAIVGGNASLVVLFALARRFLGRLRRYLIGFTALALFGLGLYQLWQAVVNSSP